MSMERTPNMDVGLMGVQNICIGILELLGVKNLVNYGHDDSEVRSRFNVRLYQDLEHHCGGLADYYTCILIILSSRYGFDVMLSIT